MTRTAHLVLALAAGLLVRVNLVAQDAARSTDLCKQAEQAFKQGDYKACWDLATEAVRLDPSNGMAWGTRGVGRASYGEFINGIEDVTRAYELTKNVAWVIWRARYYLMLDRYRQAFDDADTILKYDEIAQLLCVRGAARVQLGEVDQGIADIERGEKIIGGKDWGDRSVALIAKADWQALLEEGRAWEKQAPPIGNGYLYQARALMELGTDYEEARKAVERGEKNAPIASQTYLARALLHAFPAAKDYYDFERAYTKGVRRLRPLQLDSWQINTAARILYEAGRYFDCIHELETHGRLTNWETLFLLAASHFRVGQVAECRRYLLDARRLNPYLSRHTDRVPGLSAFLGGIDQEVEKEQTGADQAKLEAEQETAILSLAELETLVRRFQFERALAGYERYLGTLQSPTRRREAEARIADLKGAADPFRRFREKLNAGELKDVKQKVGAADVTLTKAIDDQGFEFTIKQGGGKGTWAALGPEGLLKLLDRAAPTPAERLGMGILAWDLGLSKRAMDDLQRAVKEDKALKGRLDAFVAARRGIDLPEGGFVAHQGRFVTPEEKTNLEKGLVLFQGQWVTKADHEHLAKGQIQVGGKWVPGDEKVLLAMGFRKHKGKWYTREEYTSLRAKWENAHEVKTTHYDIRTNYDEDFAQELGALCEVAYEDFKRFYGGIEPKLEAKDRMTLYAFASYEDYRKYCVEHNAEAQLQAAGFAVSNSNVVVGWNKTGEPADFLATMAHEAAHLFYFRIAKGLAAPSWYAEGMATQFEGFEWTGSSYAYNRLSRARLPFVKQAMDQRRHIPIAELVKSDALSLINSDTDKALLFYAECWALVYFLTQTEQTEFREGFQRYREAVDSGKPAALTEFFTDLGALEAEFVKFIKRK